MNLEKLYQEMGGDMADAVRRLGSIAAVERFLRMFAGDDTFAMLQAAMSAGDARRAFRAAHTLKGLAANLGLVQLGQAASARRRPCAAAICSARRRCIRRRPRHTVRRARRSEI